jgi:hypothetical protein
VSYWINSLAAKQRSYRKLSSQSMSPIRNFLFGSGIAARWGAED